MNYIIDLKHFVQLITCKTKSNSYSFIYVVDCKTVTVVSRLEALVKWLLMRESQGSLNPCFLISSRPFVWRPREFEGQHKNSTVLKSIYVHFSPSILYADRSEFDRRRKSRANFAIDSSDTGTLGDFHSITTFRPFSAFVSAILKNHAIKSPNLSG